MCALPTAGLRCVCRPFGVPDIFLADDAAASAIDPGTHLCSALSATGSAEQRGRGHSLGSLHPPPAAVASLPRFSLASPVQKVSGNKKSAIPFGMTDFLELLARFELATSSLPTILEAVLPCVACRKLLDKTLVYQGLFGFAYRCLL